MSALICWFGAPIIASLSWLLLFWVALLVDPQGRSRFLAVIALATLVGGLITGVQFVATQPDQVARMLLFEYLPTAQIIARPLVVGLGLYSLVAGPSRELDSRMGRSKLATRTLRCLRRCLGIWWVRLRDVSAVAG